jgi:putative two-component system response regulator
MRDEQRARARIMVVDDEPQNVRYVTDVLQWAGYETLEGLTDPIEAVSRFSGFNPDLVILDLLMPGLDGFEVMEAMQENVSDDVYLPFLILTSDITSESRRRALSGGARDFLTKPMSPTEVRLRVDNLLETRFLYLECARQANLLGADSEPVAEAPFVPDEASMELLERWGASIDAGLPGCEGRSKRISWLAGMLAEAMDLPGHEIDAITGAAFLHALGSRPVVGAGENGARGLHAEPGLAARLLEGSRIPALATARRMLGGLEEHWDGSGGPAGLRGEAIPIEARIVAVAAAFDDLDVRTGDGENPAEHLARLSGLRFDPDVVAALGRTQAVSA